MTFTLIEVERFPKERQAHVLYWSKEFEMSGHLCACGCGDFIQLPIGPTDFTISVGRHGPTLRPSVGNWGVCDAHYYITDGEVEWLGKLPQELISASRAIEDARRAAYYVPRHRSRLGRLWEALRTLVRKAWPPS